MTPVVTDTLTVAGAAALVAVIIQLTKFLIDLAVKDPATNIRCTRLYVYLVAVAVVALPAFEHHGFNAHGDLLSLLTLAGVVGSASLGGYHLLSQAPIGTPQTPESVTATPEHPNSP